MKHELRQLSADALHGIAKRTGVPISRLELWLADQCALSVPQIDAIEKALRDRKPPHIEEADRVFGS